MLSLITNPAGVSQCDKGATVLKGKFTTQLTNIADACINCYAENLRGHRRGILSVIFTSIAVGIAGLFNQRIVFDNNTGKLVSISKYSDGKLLKVSHFAGRMSKLNSVDEYKDGKILKTTSYDLNTGLPQWVVDYSTKGNNTLTEFYPDGKKIKSVQYDRNDVVDTKVCFDEEGRVTKDSHYNDDETLANVIIYNEDKTTYEAYDHGLLKVSTITYNKTANKVEITYDDNHKIVSAREEGKGYETYFAYENGRKIWSGTYYTEGQIAYKRVEYDIFGSPKVAYLYNNDHTLYGTTEYHDYFTRVNTRYTNDGQIEFVETVNSKTGKTANHYADVIPAFV